MQAQLLKGAALILLSELFFVLMGTQVRDLSTSLSNEMIVFFRNLFGLQILLPLWFKHGLGALKTDQMKWHLLRGVAGLSAMYCFFYAIAHMALANAMILKMSAPLFIPIIALLWLKEKLNWMIGFMVMMGFVGVSLIVKPDVTSIDTVALIALAGGFFAAIAKTTVKKLTSTEKPATIVFYFALTGMLISSIPAFLNWQTPSPAELAQLFLLGFLAASAQFFMSRAYSLAPASQISHFSYSSILYASVAGWFLWGEWMDAWSWMGALLIVLSGMLLVQPFTRQFRRHI